MIAINLTPDQLLLLSSYLSEFEEEIIERFKWTDDDGEQFYKILDVVEKAK